MPSIENRLARYRCWCGKWASKEVYNRFNALVRYLCAACANRVISRPGVSGLALDLARRELPHGPGGPPSWRRPCPSPGVDIGHSAADEADLIRKYLEESMRRRRLRLRSLRRDLCRLPHNRRF